MAIPEWAVYELESGAEVCQFGAVILFDKDENSYWVLPRDVRGLAFKDFRSVIEFPVCFSLSTATRLADEIVDGVRDGDIPDSFKPVTGVEVLGQETYSVDYRDVAHDSDGMDVDVAQCSCMNANTERACMFCKDEPASNPCPCSPLSCGHHCECAWDREPCGWCGEESDHPGWIPDKVKGLFPVDCTRCDAVFEPEEYPGGVVICQGCESVYSTEIEYDADGRAVDWGLESYLGKTGGEGVPEAVIAAQDNHKKRKPKR